jgi:uncharacterized cupin superfamily protein
MLFVPAKCKNKALHRGAILAGQRTSQHLYNHTQEKCVFMTIGDNRADDITCFPNTGKARIRATGKTVPIASV